MTCCVPFKVLAISLLLSFLLGNHLSESGRSRGGGGSRTYSSSRSSYGWKPSTHNSHKPSYPSPSIPYHRPPANRETIPKTQQKPVASAPPHKPSEVGWKSDLYKPSAPHPPPSTNNAPGAGWNIGEIKKTNTHPMNSQPNPAPYPNGQQTKPSDPGWKPDLHKPSAPYPPQGNHNNQQGGTGWNAGGIHKNNDQPVNSQPNSNWALPPAPRPGAPPPAGWNVEGHQPHQQTNVHYPTHGNPAPNIYNNYYSHPNPSHVTIINQNHHSYSYGIPQQNYHYPGYYYPQTSYHYTSGETGSGALGFFLGYSLARLTTPTYSHYSFYDGYRPRYDHYTVHHYYHNSENVPKENTIQSNTIVGCVGDTTTLCPANTTSLCTNNGVVMCVASAVTTLPCVNIGQHNCVTSTVPCLNNTSVNECKNVQPNSTTSINIPCISTANIYGDIKFINNTIIENKPVVNETTANSTGNALNGTTINNSTSIASTPTTVHNITQRATPTVNLTVAATATETKIRKRRSNPSQSFCVTIIALPAQRKMTEGEKLFHGTKNVVENFLVKSWGL